MYNLKNARFLNHSLNKTFGILKRCNTELGSRNRYKSSNYRLIFSLFNQSSIADTVTKRIIESRKVSISFAWYNLTAILGKCRLMSLIGQSETVIKVSSDRCFLSKRIGSSKASVTKLSYQQLHYKISSSFIILTRFTFLSYKVPSYVLRWYVSQYGTLTYILFLFLSSFPLSRCAKARRKRLT